MKKKLWNKNFTLLVIGQSMSLFGNMVVTAVLPFHILNISESAFLYGLAMGLPVISLIIMTPIGGILADRFKKHRLMFWLDVSITVVIVGYILTSGLFAEVVYFVIVKLLAFNAIQAIYMATTAASISLIVPSDKLTSGNAVIMVVNSLSITGGAAIAGVLYDRFGLYPILIGCAVCFVITAIVDLFIRIPYKKQKTSGNIAQIIRGDLSASFRFMLKENRTIAKCVVPIFFIEFLFGSMITIGLPVLITIYLGFGMTQVGIALSIIMFGGVLGGFVAGILGKRLNISRGFLFLAIAGLFSIPMGFVFLFDLPIFTAYIVLTVAGTIFVFSAKILTIAMITFVQKETPIELIGKVLSIAMIVPFIGQSIGYPLQGMLFHRFSASPWAVIFSVVFVMIIVSVYMFHQFKNIERSKNAAE
ncbi:MAG: MFS transporter [Treponema sp.]|nr:MFS transporter [Treponema sp.]